MKTPANALLCRLFPPEEDLQMVFFEDAVVELPERPVLFRRYSLFEVHEFPSGFEHAFRERDGARV